MEMKQKPVIILNVTFYNRSVQGLQIKAFSIFPEDLAPCLGGRGILSHLCPVMTPDELLESFLCHTIRIH